MTQAKERAIELINSGQTYAAAAEQTGLTIYQVMAHAKKARRDGTLLKRKHRKIYVAVSTDGTETRYTGQAEIEHAGYIYQSVHGAAKGERVYQGKKWFMVNVDG